MALLLVLLCKVQVLPKLAVSFLGAGTLLCTQVKPIFRVTFSATVWEPSAKHCPENRSGFA